MISEDEARRAYQKHVAGNPPAPAEAEIPVPARWRNGPKEAVQAAPSTGAPMWQVLSAVALCIMFPPFLLVLAVWALAKVGSR